MAERRGYIYLERKIQDSAIWTSNEPFDRRSAWIDLLMMVNHEDAEIMINGKMRIIRRGQRWTSILSLAKQWHWSRDKVSSFLYTLESAGMVTTDRNSFGTLINIVNYSVYQHKNGGVSATKSTTNRQQVDNGPTTDSSQTSNDISKDKGMNNKKGVKALGRVLQ